MKRDGANMAEKKYNFESLTPIDNVELEVYDDAINFVFENSDISNVAISGAYSSGKSSLLESYKKKHPDLRFLHISLAHFKNLEEDDKVEADTLEEKIINQLIHQIPSEKIPQTAFSVKKKISIKKTAITTLLIMMFFVAVFYLIEFNEIKYYTFSMPEGLIKSFLMFILQPMALLIDACAIITLSSIFIYKAICFQKNRNVIRKINIKGTEVDVSGGNSDESFFDKYLNEVVYLFENADADVIVFEDMDRFGANQIFERLREINTLVNLSRKQDNKQGIIQKFTSMVKNEIISKINIKSKDKTLRFFYLLRDDIFDSKDRTKFFDYIIPVVPFIDSSNSYDQFINILKRNKLLEKFDEKFLQDISLYIDDMRLLKNIYNEFIIYYNKLNITELDCNKMLAMIAYKNLFPSDFSNLQLNKGFVYTLFDKKEEFIQDELKKVQNNIDYINNQIKSSKKEHLISLRELDAVFADKYFKSNNWQYFDDSTLSNFVNSNLDASKKGEYLSRKESIKNKTKEKLQELEEKLSSCNNEMNTLKSKKLHQIVCRENMDEIFDSTHTNEREKETDFNEVKSNDYFGLLKYLIRNGYIDETYADYMTYFHGYSLTRTDKIFLRSITDKKAKEYSYSLTNPQLVVSRLHLADFDQEEILNFDLLEYLLQNSPDEEKLKHLIDQLKETKNFNFIGGFLDTQKEILNFIIWLNKRWSEIFYTALTENTLTEMQIRDYSIYSIYCGDDEILRGIDKDNCLSKYISNAPDYLAIREPDIKKLINGFIVLKVKFAGFDYEEIDKSLFERVYEECLYEINFENIALIQRKILGIRSEDEILYKNYTILCQNPDAAITKYLNQNIDEYFDIILQECNSIITDDEKVAILVLNNSNLTIEKKQDYISALQTIITFIRDIEEKSLWENLLDNDRVKFSENNLIDCFKEMGLNEKVIMYINRCNIDFDFATIECDDALKDKLLDAVAKCNEIENEKYKQILISLGRFYDEFSIPNISADKVTILIDAGIIDMTTSNLKYIRDNYAKQKLNYISKNIEKYVEIMDEELFLQNELLEILAWETDDILKMELLKYSKEPISIIGANYSSTVCKYILDNNFMQSDLFKLFYSFDEWDDLIKEKIFDHAVINIARIIKERNHISLDLLYRLFETARLSRNEKIDLLIAELSNPGEKNIKHILKLLYLTEYLKIYEIRTRPKLKVNEENEKLLAAFKNEGIIDDYKENNKGQYTISRPAKNNRKKPF